MGRSWNDTVCSSVRKNKAKRFANQLLTDFINASLAFVVGFSCEQSQMVTP